MVSKLNKVFRPIINKNDKVAQSINKINIKTTEADRRQLVTAATSSAIVVARRAILSTHVGTLDHSYAPIVAVKVTKKKTAHF